MASIQPIESSSVHRIQSGQVIVDLCSVVKELVENSIDAGATSVEVRFKNSGLDAIEVADNGSGIAQEDYESVALKHYTSKLRNYDDLTLLNTFGFRGEALSSLCALSDLHIVTAQEHEAPKGTRLDLEQSGKLKGTTTIAAQPGTTVYVETIFKNLPVRRQELTKNIKREYGKVLGLLQAYACISTKARVSVSNVAAKGRKTIQFATKANQTTRENIANVYGTKTTAMLIPLDLQLDMQSTGGSSSQRSRQVKIVGHVSRPTVGEGRQTPDRQMFFVNGRPCALPQVAKAMNEVYKSYNLSQSPFIFADVQLDTNGYDVNVSPDKRTIMLHDQGQLLESLKDSLVELFDNQQQSVPQAKAAWTPGKLPAFSPLTLTKTPKSSLSTVFNTSSCAPSQTPAVESQTAALPPTEAVIGGTGSDTSAIAEGSNVDDSVTAPAREGQGDLVQKLFTHKVQGRINPAFRKPTVDKTADRNETPTREANMKSVDEDFGQEDSLFVEADVPVPSNQAGESLKADQDVSSETPFSDHSHDTALKKTQANGTGQVASSQDSISSVRRAIGSFASGMDEEENSLGQSVNPALQLAAEEPIPSTKTTPLKARSGPVPSAFDRMRPLRTPVQKATITIGDQSTTTMIGSSSQKQWSFQTDTTKSKVRSRVTPKQGIQPTFQSSLRAFAAPGSQMRRQVDDDVESEDEHGDGSTPLPSRKRHPPRASMDQRLERVEPTELEDEAVEDDDEQTEDGEIDSVRENQPAQVVSGGESDSDGEYLDEAAKKDKEDARVAKLIHEAELRAAQPTEETLKRAGRLLTGGRRTGTTNLVLSVSEGTQQILEQARNAGTISATDGRSSQSADDQLEESSTAEERLSLTVTKNDFGRMRIAGQFNLGFIIAVRPADPHHSSGDASHANNELFIIDQHASDEKYNFERLQATTVVQNQPLVHKQRLDLTAIEEEIIIENNSTLQKNGFEVEIDESGDYPVGKRCTLVRLPMSKEVTFSTRDLEELIALLAESPPASTQPQASATSLSLTAPSSSTNSASSFLTPVIRPSAVRKMFAMRACRSSVMIGKTLSNRQMKGLVTNMGQMEKPWNCPHGRPTMRHLYSLSQWSGWKEGDGVAGMIDDDDFAGSGLGNGSEVDWSAWLGNGSDEDEEDEELSTSQEEEDQEENSDDVDGGESEKEEAEDANMEGD